MAAMSNPKLAIVIGSIRPNRFADRAARWITEIATERGDFEIELIDLKDYPMPPFAEEASPAFAPSRDEVARRWQKTQTMPVHADPLKFQMHRSGA
jgi:NAD(P)H-dependent FMN reductase